MTETQTPTCNACGDTGFVPPFMDPCTACAATTTRRIDVWAPEAATGSPAVAFVGSPVVDGTVRVSSTGEFLVYADGDWLPVPTETLTAAEYAAKYKVIDTAEVVEATIAAAHVADVDAEGTIDSCPACGGDGFHLLEDDDGDYTEQCAACRGTGLHPDHLAPVTPTTEPEPERHIGDGPGFSSKTKTSKDTFADLVAACEAIPTPEPKPEPPKPDYAAGYGEAGIYSDPSISYGSSKTKPAAKPMTEAQETLMRKLVAERNPLDPVVANAQANLDDGGVTAKRASNLIDNLMKVPADPAKKAPRKNSYAGTCGKCKGPVEAGAGRIEKNSTGRWDTYHLDGACLTPAEVAAADADKVVEPGLYKVVTTTSPTIYRVRKSRTTDRLYGELITMRHDGTVGFAYNANAMTFLRASDKLTWKEARDFGAAYGACVACGRTLSDPRSLVQGYGPTCGARYHWPLVTAKQAEAIIEGVMTWEEVTGLAI
jgi:hypothetical protein